MPSKVRKSSLQFADEPQKVNELPAQKHALCLDRVNVPLALLQSEQLPLDIPDTVKLQLTGTKTQSPQLSDKVENDDEL